MRDLVMGGTVALCVLAVLAVGFHRNAGTELVEQANNLEVTAYLSTSQAEEFKSLVAKEASYAAGITDLLKEEAAMPPEDTKVRFVSFSPFSIYSL